MAGSDSEVLCGFCHRGSEVNEQCGELHTASGCSAHHKCMQYSSGLKQYTFHHFGGFKIDEVLREQRRGGKLKCALCSKKGSTKKNVKKIFKGASAGCAYSRCSKSFHFSCVALGLDDQATYYRYTQEDKLRGKVVKYRVFCGPKHKEMYEEIEENNEGVATVDSSSNIDSDEVSAHTDNELVLSDFEEPHSASKKPRLAVEEADTRTPTIVHKDKTSSKNKNNLNLSVTKDEVERVTPPASRRSLVSSCEKKTLKRKSNNGKASTGKNTSNIKLVSDTSSSDEDETPTRTTRSTSGSSEKKDKNSNEQATPIKYERIDSSFGELGPADGAVSNDTKAKGTRKSGSQEVLENSVHKQVHVKLEQNGTNNSSPAKGQRCNRDCLLYLVEGDYSPQSMQQEITILAESSYSVSPDSVFDWRQCASSIPLTNQQMLYFFSRLSKLLREKDYSHFSKLLRQLDQKSIAEFNVKIDYNNRKDSSELREIVHSVHTMIDQNLEKACREYWGAGELASLYCLDEEQVFVMTVLLNDVTDCDGRIRQFLTWGEGSGLFEWDNDTVVSAHSAYMTSDLEWFRRAESEVVRCEVEDHVRQKSTVCVTSFPSEEVLKGDRQSSIVNILADITSTVSAPAKLLFLGPINCSVVKQKNYYKQTLQYMVTNQLDKDDDLLCVMDLQGEPFKRTDIVPDILKRHTEMWSAFDPSKFPVTCVLVYIPLSGTQNKKLSKMEKK